MPKFLLAAVFFLWTSACCAQKALDIKRTRVLKEKILEISENTNTIDCDFKQYKHLSFLSNDIETSGKMAFKNQSWVKWEYTWPYKYKVIFKENKLLINDDGNKTSMDIASNKLFKSLSNLIVKSVSGRLFNTGEFEITYYETPNHYLVQFTPSDESMVNYIKTFDLLFGKDNFQVAEIKITEPSDDYTRIVLENIQYNVHILDEEFNN